MLPRLAWKVVPPLLAISALFCAQWALASTRLNASEAVAQQQQKQASQQQAQAAATAAAAKARQQFSLELRAVGLTIDRYRQLAVWEKLDLVNHPLKTILSQNPEDYEWGGSYRDDQYNKRANDAYANALALWTERWPIPVLISSAFKNGPNRLQWMDGGSGLGITLTTALGWHQGEGSDVLLSQLFKAFDDNPELPAVLVVAMDSQQDILNISIKDEKFVPSMPDTAVALLFTRTDRVDQYIRPYTVDVPYNINKFDTEYDVIKLWNYFFEQDRISQEHPEHYGTMPTSFWRQQVNSLISQVDPHGAQSIMPFWNSGKAGFHPSPWIPVRWTKWQLEDEYDRAPIIGHLHRPVEVNLEGKSQAARAEAMQTAWHQALATLPDSEKPEWLFYDTGSDGKHVIPLARAMTQEYTQHPLDVADTAHSYNLSSRIGNTGVASPFVQLALAAMRSYEKGGNSATVNLRQAGSRASIIMLSAPTPQEKANNKPNPHNWHGPNDPDPFLSKIK